ncbi:MAG: MFS transporter [Bacteroidia bacterium]
MTADKKKSVTMLIIVAALGYFVDIYDLVVFNVVKKESMAALGIPAEKEIFLFNMQMIGMLIGGILWGILGDKKGRISVLFGSIFLYSAANIANSFATGLVDYSIYRFLAGIGLAGELGAGITLVAESMDKEKRGYGTMVIVTLGALGAVAASLVGNNLGWKNTYLVGGGLGLALLLLRAGAFESGMYKSMAHSKVVKGSFIQLFTNKERFLKYLNCILIGLPIWFAIGVLINLSNKFGEVIGVSEPVKVADSVMYTYIGLSFGDLLSGLLSQVFRSRKKVVIGYLILSVVLLLIYLFNHNVSIAYFHFFCFLLGTATGYWALFVTIASEQFGTNIRSTVTTTVPNFVRGAVVPITLSFTALTPYVGILYSALIVGGVCLALAFYAILNVKETFSKDLDYVDEIA